MWIPPSVSNTNEEIMCLNNSTIETFHFSSENYLPTLMFHHLHDFAEALNIFGKLSVLDASLM